MMRYREIAPSISVTIGIPTQSEPRMLPWRVETRMVAEAIRSIAMDEFESHDWTPVATYADGYSQQRQYSERRITIGLSRIQVTFYREPIAEESTS